MGTNEDSAKKALGIDSWRNLSKEKVLAFIEVVPSLDKDVALAIVGQLPDFKDFALGAMKNLEKQYKAALDSDRKSQKRVHDAFKDYRSALKRELRNGDLTPEQRLHILGLIKEAADRDYAKDSEHKAFVLKLTGIFVAVVFALVAGVIAIATGGRVRVKSPV